MFSIVRWQIIVDFLVLAAAFYALLRWASSARALRIALAVVGLHVLALLAQRLDLVITGWLLEGLALLAIVLLLLIFQPELRRAFMRLDRVLRPKSRPAAADSECNSLLAESAFDLARTGLGALIVVLRDDSIGELTEGGVTLGSAMSAELLVAIFQKLSPLHDGATVVEGGSITKAGVVLPLTQRPDVPGHYGTRHRAGMGLAERSDALVIVVSEERSEVTLMYGGERRLIARPGELVSALEKLQSAKREPAFARFRRFFKTNLRMKLAALGLAGLIWSMSFLASGTTIRTVTVPIEFSNVPIGMEITGQSADSLEVQVRGSPWIMDSVSLGALVARVDLSNLTAGIHQLRMPSQSLDLPPGIKVDRVSPPRIRVVLTRAGRGSR